MFIEKIVIIFIIISPELKRNNCVVLLDDKLLFELPPFVFVMSAKALLAVFVVVVGLEMYG